MSLDKLLRAVRSRLILIVSTIVLFALAGLAAGLVRPNSYVATVTLYVAATDPANTNAAYQGGLLSQQRVTSYVELVKSDPVLDRVTSISTTRRDAKDLAGDIDVTSIPNSVLLNVAVTSDSPEDAAGTANLVGQVFADFVSQLERPTVPNQAPQVSVKLIAPAATPESPSTPSLPVVVVSAVLLGIVVGLSLAVATEVLNNRIRTTDDLDDEADASALGLIFEEQHGQAADQRFLEQFRQLRTNLQFIDIDRPPQTILITSPLPGEGKSTVTINLGRVLAAAGSKVLVVDCDLRRPAIAQRLDLESQAGLTTILVRRADYKQVLQRSGLNGFDVITSGKLPPNPSELLASASMVQTVGLLRREYDYILLDSAPLLPVTDSSALASASDGAILVCCSGRTRVSQIRVAQQRLRAVSARILGIVVNRAPASYRRRLGSYSTYGDYSANDDQDVRFGAVAQDLLPRSSAELTRPTPNAKLRS